ncbi:MAG: Mut7-C RNAse domain-containing protein [Nitrosarchaeum sp.]|nr:Mut7-C RNAse domain-containing protein [Nitrosarchaeum sp.]
MPQSKFIIDAMLGNVAKKLRLLGYDSKYFADIDDNKLVDIARKEDRIIISRDVELSRRAKKIGLDVILVTSQDEVEMFRDIVIHANLEISKINGDDARCPKCNYITTLTDKRTIKEKIPEKVYQVNDKFWICDNCNQVYWEGTHIENLQEFVNKINETT